MASHPYISGPGNIVQMVGYLRKNFPAIVTADTVKKFQLAPQNESYVINSLQFIGVLDEESKRTDKGRDVLLLGDTEFPKAFEGLVRQAYDDLFETRGEGAWSLSKTELTGYFRATDKTSDVIGSRQAGVFQAFSALAGHELVTSPRARQGSSKVKPNKVKHQKQNETKLVQDVKKPQALDESPKGGRKDMALTVRIEINLPLEGSRETYDNIFKSIKANLINE